ncbi:hypothetical protein J6590_102968 [Homalodisca vitripennis]|nr:hypothetical protein J6590_102968 [Homalodisca vitripennis]
MYRHITGWRGTLRRHTSAGNSAIGPISSHTVTSTKTSSSRCFCDHFNHKYIRGLAWGWTLRVPSTSRSLPCYTRLGADHPSLPIQEKLPVALQRLTALINPATSWSDPKIMAPGTPKSLTNPPLTRCLKTPA